ncbi:MAG: response regulator [Notoacmeibacter sp.]|nr:response regulator [Notoacmeibacter sp.]
MNGPAQRLLSAARYAFLVIFAILIGSTASAFLALNEVQDRIRIRIPENTIWAAAQGEIELGRLLAQLAPLAAGARQEQADTPLVMQFDLLWSRVGLFRSGALGQALVLEPGLAQVFADYSAALEKADSHLKDAANGDASAARSMLELLSPHRETIRKLTMASLNNDRRERELLANNHDLLQKQVSRFGAAAAVLLCVMLIYLIYGERRARHLLSASELAHQQIEEARTRSEKQAGQMKLLARKATAASQAKSEFLAMMSHDIRTPLTAIIGLSEIMERQEPDEEKRKRVNVILKASEGLLSLINDILDLTRLEAGKLRLEPSEFSPAGLVREIMDVTEILARRNGNTIAVEIDPRLPAAMIGDSDRIRQVLMNLVGNANKFTRHGDVHVRITCEGRRDSKARVRFLVSDTGEGIAQDLQRRLFQPFEQGENSRAAHGGSSGLGLAISERLVRLMGGTMDVNSTPGAGSAFSFVVELGIGAASSAVPVEAERAGTLDLTGRKVLVVDDTPASLMVAETMFANFGADVTAAGGGREAVALAAQNAFDMVVLDVQMPGMDGPAAMKVIREEGASRDAVFVALTAQSFPRDRARLLRAGFDVYVSKPVRMKDIEAALSGRFGPAVPQPDLVQEKAQDAASAARDALDLDFIRTMNEDIGSGTMRTLVNQVEAEVEAGLDRLSELAAAEHPDGEGVRKAAHKLAGLFGQFGLSGASRLARAIEADASHGISEAQADQLVSAARDGLQALRQYLRAQDDTHAGIAA